MKQIAPLVIALLILGVGIVYFLQKQPNAQPGTENLVAGNPDVTNAPAAVPVDVTQAPLFTHPTFGYSLRLPDSLKVEEQGSNNIMLLPKNQQSGPGVANFIYISVIPPEKKTAEGEIYNYSPQDFEKLTAIATLGEKVSLAKGNGQDEWFTYTYVDEAEIDGKTAKAYENTKPWEFPQGTTEGRFIMEDKGTIYLLGYYTGGESVKPEAAIDPRLAYSIIQSFDIR